MDILENAVIILTALIINLVWHSPPDIWERLEAYYERLKYIIGSLFVKA